MTRGKPTLPTYNLATNPRRLLEPPFALNGSRMFYLPLRARRDRLQSVLDQYFNQYADPARRVPRGRDWFGVSAPFVWLTLADYGSLASDVANQGWVAYDEILFAIPVTWYQRDDENQPFAFRAFATFAPVIYVSDQAAQWLGREVLGWVKTHAEIRTSPSAWANTGAGPYEMLSVYQRGFQQSFADQTQSVQRLLTITRDSQAIVGRIPPDYDGMFNPLAAIPSAMTDAYRMMGEMYRAYLGDPSFGMPPGLPNPWAPLTYAQLMNPLSWMDAVWTVQARNSAQQVFEVMSGMQYQMAANTLNRKQFPNAADSQRACYSAITNAPLQIIQIYSLGLLGTSNILKGQLSGGYQVHIPARDSQPIVKNLGLETVSSFHTHDGQRVDVVEPILPMWLHGDLSLAAAENYEVRTMDAVYRDTLPQSRPAGVPPFMATRSAVRVLPIAAEPGILQRFVDDYLGALDLPSASDSPSRDASERSRFEIVGDRVYVITADFCNMTSILQPAGFLDIRELLFMFPVRWHGAPSNDHDDIYWLAPYSFPDNDAWAITMREADGFDAWVSMLESPPNGWMDRCGPDHPPRTVLRVWTEVLPALDVGEAASEQVILEVVSGDLRPEAHECEEHEHPNVDDAAGSATSPRPEPDAREDARQDVPRHGMLCEGPWSDATRSIPLLTLKQFRDAELPQRACFQALVQAPVRVTVQQRGGLEGPVFVKIPLFQDLPLTQRMGLEPTWTESTTARLVDVFRTHDPFWIDAKVEFEKAQTITWRDDVAGDDHGWREFPYERVGHGD